MCTGTTIAKSRTRTNTLGSTAVWHYFVLSNPEPNANTYPDPDPDPNP